ncbi:hypothetical protein [Nocardia sp. NPDC003963]
MPDPRADLAEYCTNLIEGIAFADTGEEAAEHIATTLRWRPPARVIEHAAELDALPAGSVVMMTTWMRRAFVHAGGGRWWVAGPIRSEISAADVLDGCAVEVLHTPENGDT